MLSSGQHFITTNPTTTTCTHCSSTVLAATVAGLDVHVDPVALTDVGELAVLLAGRRSFSLSGERLFRRRPEHITSDRGGVVLGEHGCVQVPDEHVDHTVLATATALLRSALGAVVVQAGDDTPPPF